MPGLRVDILSLSIIAAMMVWWLSGRVPPELLMRVHMDTWFDSDIPRVVQNMTVHEEGHSTTYKHPLFPLLAWPMTAALTQATGDAVVSVRLLLSLNAALSLTILLAMLARIGLGSLDRALTAAFFMTSAAFTLWFGVPETFPFGATSILFGLWAAVVASQDKPSTAVLIALGVIALAITITNIGVFALVLASGRRCSR